LCTIRARLIKDAPRLSQESLPGALDAGQFAVTPAFLMIGTHLSISVRTSSPSAAGAWPASSASSAAEIEEALAHALVLQRRARGRVHLVDHLLGGALGPNSAFQPVAWNCGMPCSAAVGVSGITGTRFCTATTRPLTSLPWICGTMPTVWSQT
jgi:hypothetical protein